MTIYNKKEAIQSMLLASFFMCYDVLLDHFYISKV